MLTRGLRAARTLLQVERGVEYRGRQETNPTVAWPLLGAGGCFDTQDLHVSSEPPAGGLIPAGHMRNPDLLRSCSSEAVEGDQDAGAQAASTVAAGVLSWGEWLGHGLGVAAVGDEGEEDRWYRTWLPGILWGAVLSINRYRLPPTCKTGHGQLEMGAAACADLGQSLALPSGKLPRKFQMLKHPSFLFLTRSLLDHNPNVSLFSQIISLFPSERRQGSKQTNKKQDKRSQTQEK